MRLEFDEIQTNRLSKRISNDRRYFRCRFALKFGDAKSVDQEGVRRGLIREAFNSPFKPFILATTSVGQEGLDFSPWDDYATFSQLRKLHFPLTPKAFLVNVRLFSPTRLGEEPTL